MVHNIVFGSKYLAHKFKSFSLKFKIKNISYNIFTQRLCHEHNMTMSIIFVRFEISYPKESNLLPYFAHSLVEKRFIMSIIAS